MQEEGPRSGPPAHAAGHRRPDADCPHVTGGARRRGADAGCSEPARRDGKGTGDTELSLTVILGRPFSSTS